MPDPASPEAIKHLTDAGLNIYDVVKGADSITNGINKVRELFKQNRLKIHENCKNLIWELETYAYAENSEKPIKEGDHALDSLRYTIMTNTPDNFIKNIEKVRNYHTRQFRIKKFANKNI